MAFIEKRKNGRYRARYRGPDGRERSRTFDRKLDANAWVTSQEAAGDRGEWTDPTLGNTPFAEWAARFQEGRVHLRESTRARDQTLMDRLVLPNFGDFRLASVRPADVQGWVSNLVSRGYAASTVRKAYQLAAGVFRSAVNSDVIRRSPCRNIDLPRAEQVEMRFLDPTELQTLADAHEPRFRALVLTAGYTGLRWGELAALARDDINLLRRTVTVSKSLSEVKGVLTVTTPKTKAARRTVAIPSTIADLIGAHLGTFPSQGPVFSASDGGPLRRTNFRLRRWLPAVRDSVGEPCRFHDLRHSHVALLIGAGEHPQTIASRLGHTSVRTVLDVYGHLFDGLDKAAAERLDAIVSENLAASVRPGA